LIHQVPVPRATSQWGHQRLSRHEPRQRSRRDARAPLTSANLNGVIVASSIVGPTGQGLSAGEFNELVGKLQ